jgi:signal transduction histidine kinase
VLAIASRLRLPRWTLRLRLTLLYGGLFLIAGAVLLAITYGLVANSTPITHRAVSFVGGPPKSLGASLPAVPREVANGRQVYLAAQSGPPGAAVQLRDYAGKVNKTFRKLTAAQAAQAQQLISKARADLSRQSTSELDALLTRSGVALGIMALLSIGFGWLMAGRALRPVRTMGARARGISERNLHQRLALEGPNDELKELGDTFDGLLGRLESAFESQRRFVANASHELRTPMTLSRTLIEVALADPNASAASLRDTCRRVLAAGEQQERLVAALLTLARSQRGLAVREELELGAIVGEVMRGVPQNGVAVKPELGEAWTTGDPALVERLVANLVDNALKYNQTDGWVSARTGVRDGKATLTVANSGPAVAPEEADALTEPFRRLNGDRAARVRGLGLGLSIVQAIARAHGAELRTTPRPEGGLEVEVGFPPRQPVPLH